MTRPEDRPPRADLPDLETDLELEALVQRHLQWGWWSLAVFLSLGIVLEAFHGFKVDWYLSVANETRRLLWRLAHAHGTLLGLVHIAFATTVRIGGTAPGAARRLASKALIGATILLPGGFLLGGWSVQGGDPDRGVFLVPAGALLLLLATVLAAIGPRRRA